MLNRLPRSVPCLFDLLSDLGNPSNAAVGLALGVTARTVTRWREEGAAPKAESLALFWLTRWGRSAVDAQAVNEARDAWGMVACLKRENEALRASLAAAEALRGDGAANEAAIDPSQPARFRYPVSRHAP